MAVAPGEDVPAGIGITEGGGTGEDFFGAAVPEVADVEDGVDDAGGVAVGDLAGLDAIEGGAGGRGLVGTLFGGEGRDDVEEVAMEDAGGTGDLAGVAEDGGAVVVGVGEATEGEVAGGEGLIGGDGGERGGGGGELVLEAVVGTGVEVAGGAGGFAVAAGLHVPEEGLAKNDQGAGVADVAVETGGSGDGDGLERGEGGRAAAGGLGGEGGGEGGDEQDGGKFHWMLLVPANPGSGVMSR